MAKFTGSRKICFVSQESPLGKCWEQAVGRVTPGESPRSPGPASLAEGRGICPAQEPQPRGAGGAQLLLLPVQQLCLCPPCFLGLLLGFALFPPFPGKLAARLRLVVVEDGKNPRIVRAGVRAVWDHPGLCKGSAWVCNLSLQKFYLQNCKISWYEIFVIFGHL